jgi:succinyl-CoA synthetase alpha subunit
MTELVELRSGVYHDSVTLLRISQAAADAPGITAAQVAMATPLNVELAVGLGFDIPAGAGPNDLLVALRGADDAAIAAGVGALRSALDAAEAAGRTAGGFGEAEPPRSVRSAAERSPDAAVVLLSVPGNAVLGEAMDAIAAGRHVMIFSDNVPVAHEVALKDAAAEAGVLVMGPDCGTAIVGGVGLGFANVLGAATARPVPESAADRAAPGTARSGTGASGTVGVIAASGTGAQQLTCLLDEAGVPVSAVLGLGGRDLSEAVGGRSALAALVMLDADPGTDHIVIVSKPPHPATADRVLAAARSASKPVTTVLLGRGRPNITSATESVLRAVGAPVPVWPKWSAERSTADAPAGSGGPSVTGSPGLTPSPAAGLAAAGAGALRGLFSGGTLADEAMLVAGEVLGDIRSNIPLRPELALPAGATGHGLPQLAGLGHVIVDLGDDEFTQGRPHPMIDPTVKLDLLAAQAADPDVTVILLDVVLGYGSEPDPAGRLALAISRAIGTAAAGGRTLTVVVSLCGTAGDPQDRAAQATALAHAGADVYLSNAAAAGAAARAAAGFPAGTDTPPSSRVSQAAPGRSDRHTTPEEGNGASGNRSLGPDLLAGPPAVITAGIDLLADALRAQAVDVTVVDFRPPAVDPADPVGTGAALSTVLADPRREQANATAVRRMLDVRARLVDVLPASQALGLAPGQFCHAGPPISWERASGPLRGALIGAMLFEQLASSPAEAEAKLAAGDGISFSPCHENHAVGPMAGVISPSMWMFKLVDEDTGAVAYCSLNEGLGKVLRYGAYSAEVIDRLRWMSEVLGPALATAVRAVADSTGPIDITAIVGQMVQMGDEGHNRNRAGTLMFLREILPTLISSGLPASDVAAVAAFIGGNDHFFLNLVMPCGKLMGDAAADVPGSSLVTAMCRNGTDFGIRVSGTGDTWFTGPAGTPDGLFLAGFGPDDANPDIGDSAITETVGIGGMSMATAPAIVRFVGGAVPDALAVTRRMYEITLAENPAFAIPILEFRGAPTGIDVTRVLRTGILPQINTGMAGKVAGTGQVGAGLVTPPMGCFTAAITALAQRVPA